VTESVGRPAYQQVADDLRRRIASAELPVGSAIPSTAKLSKTYGVSITVVRAAVAQLRGDGLLMGQPGKGVFVRATPDTLAERTATVEDLARQIEDLRAELRRIESTQRDQAAAEFAELRQQVGLIHKHLADLYAQLGRPYPGDDPESLPAVQAAGGGHAEERPAASP
jgi:GntR family transcriptional regulator